MKYDDIEELKARIIAVLDVTDFLDLIGFTMADLVYSLEEEIEENYEKLDRACR